MLSTKLCLISVNVINETDYVVRASLLTKNLKNFCANFRVDLFLFLFNLSYDRDCVTESSGKKSCI